MSTQSFADLTAIAVPATPLLITMWTDLRARLVYPLVIVLGLMGALVIACVGPMGWPSALLGAGGVAGVAAFLVVLLQWLRPAATSPLGSGDVLIAALIGAIFGPQQAPAVLFSGMFLAAIVAGLLLLTRRMHREAMIPYGVYLCGAALVALVVR